MVTGYEIELICGEYACVDRDEENGKRKIISWSPDSVYKATLHANGREVLCRYATTKEMASDLIRRETPITVDSDIAYTVTNVFQNHCAVAV